MEVTQCSHRNLWQKLRQHKRVIHGRTVGQFQSNPVRANIRVHHTSRYCGGQSCRHNGGRHSQSSRDTSKYVEMHFESCTAGHISVLRDRATRAVFVSLGSPDAFSPYPPVHKKCENWLTVPCSWMGKEESHQMQIKKKWRKKIKEQGDMVCGFFVRVLVLAHEDWAFTFKSHHPWKSQLQALHPSLIFLQNGPTVPGLHCVIFLDSSFCCHGVVCPWQFNPS